MERLWNLMLLKEKRVRRQQMLQALVEFQFKAVITSRITSIVRVGKRTERDRKVLLKAKPNNAGPIAGGEGSHLTICGDPMGVDHSIPTLLCKEK
ncbi:hypothetical protein LEMLEM_LOCUS1639 [Lemmus lemmus]